VHQQVVDGHGGFKRVAKWIQTDQRTQLAWVVALVTFGMSAVLDNLTTTIVLLSVLQVCF
jgi:Na+/H+ antiporter NhaD/arsenite permease-like protein